MLNIARIILYRLFSVSAFTFLSSVFVFFFYGFLSAFAVCFVGVTGILYNAQDLLLYHPYDPPESRLFVLEPSNFKLPYESIKIKSQDGFRIHMFLIKQTNNSNHIPTMVFFHGNAGNMGQRLANAAGFYSKLNINILMVEYRGYGLSEGAPSERGLYGDARAALDYALRRADLDRTKIFLFGRSLGGAVAIDLASRVEWRRRVWALVVENTFTSVPDMARVVLKWRCLRWLPGVVHKNKYMSLSKMSDIVAPTLVICGSNDALVPPAMATKLYKKCGSVVKKIAVMPGGGHNDTWTCREYYSTIRQFLVNVPPLADDKPFYDDDGAEVLKHNVVHTV